jgi:hypothetical protein
MIRKLRIALANWIMPKPRLADLLYPNTNWHEVDLGGGVTFIQFGGPRQTKP